VQKFNLGIFTVAKTPVVYIANIENLFVESCSEERATCSRIIDRAILRAPASSLPAREFTEDRCRGVQSEKGSTRRGGG